MPTMTEAATHPLATCAVPLLVLPTDPADGPPRLDQSTCDLWARAEAGLQELLVVLESSGGAQVDKRFDRTQELMDALGRQLAASAGYPNAKALPPPVQVHSDYFRVRHAPLSAEQQAAQAIANVYRTLADLRYARLEINDVLAELASMRTVLERLRPQASEVAQVATASNEAWFVPTGDWLDRWFLVHHFYFLLNVHAKDELRAAARAATQGSSREAATRLSLAASYIRGFTAAMIHSGAMPARYYREVVRPTMAPPFVEISLSGVMQVEHRRYRAALDEVLQALPQPFAQLSATDRLLAAARDEVLEADLLDLERHVTIAAVLVDGDRSLVQPGTTAQNSTSTLRKMRHLRAARYCPLMQFGDQWISRTIR
ncbi:hypothetical protein [Micromonospora sp. LOL_021]|uniref:hypothetical protein n=1 Tax=Micromonospora sp. LOL_021 TaxID=3345417 RepID=UPI003A8BA95A